MEYQPPPDPADIEWRIEGDGRSWGKEEVWPRYDLAPAKIELIDSKLFCGDEERLRVLGLLLENCGAEAAVRMGDPEIWRQAAASLSDPEATFRHELQAAYRRWDGFNEFEPIRAWCFYDQLTTPDYTENGDASDPSQAKTRDQILSQLKLAVEKKQENSPGYSQPETRIERFQLTGETATAIASRTVRRQSFKPIDASRWQTLPLAVEGQRWRETWVRTSAGWRLQKRECIERAELSVGPDAVGT